VSVTQLPYIGLPIEVSSIFGIIFSITKKDEVCGVVTPAGSRIEDVKWEELTNINIETLSKLKNFEDHHVRGSKQSIYGGMFDRVTI